MSLVNAEDPRVLVAADPVAASVAAPSFGPHHRDNAVLRFLLRDVIAGGAALAAAQDIARIEADLALARQERDDAFTAWRHSRDAVERARRGEEEEDQKKIA